MKTKHYEVLVGDFETTVYKGQEFTEVWASAIVPLFSEDVVVLKSISETWKYLKSLKGNILIYYHNLKFDGMFWLAYFLEKLKLQQAFLPFNEEKTEGKWLNEKQMLNNTFKYSISDKGQFYNIIIKQGNRFIEIRDSLKLLPFSVKAIGEGFKTKHRKLDMEYTGFRYSGCEITPEEIEYIKNDVLVVKEALEMMYTQGHTALTIGSCCLEEFKSGYDKQDYTAFFPDIYDIPIEELGISQGDFVRKSYRGGWTYLVKGKEARLFKNGCTFDVNSLYPSMMHSESGNRYPVGRGTYWQGDITDAAIGENKYYFVRIKTRFKLKKNYLPFIQIKGNYLYKGSECLTTSDVLKNGKYQRFYRDAAGDLQDSAVELTLTMTDFELVKEHYDLYDLQILDGIWFYAEIGLFDDYINKYKSIKMTSKGAKRESAKLFLNNLYGKMASSKDSSFKKVFLKEDGSIGFISIPEQSKKPGYIPIGSAITSYARNFTIRAAQKNYHGAHRKGFIYADTDSIHCDIDYRDIKGIKVHESNFCCWKCESLWDFGWFVRQKTYIEHVTHSDLELIKAYYNVKCAGMPKRSKALFIESITREGEVKAENEEEEEFLKDDRELKDFNIGLEVPGKLRPVRIRGGVVLMDTPYKMRRV